MKSLPLKKLIGFIMYNTFGKINTKSKIILMASEEDSNSKKAPLKNNDASFP